MNAAQSERAAAAAGKRPPRQGANDLAGDASREARRLAAAVLEVLAGGRTPAQAAEALSVSLPRYYQLERRALGGLLEACEAQPRGRQANFERDMWQWKQEAERWRQEASRQQTLLRLAQRSLGLAAPAPVKESDKKKRKRRPAARALRAAAALQAEAQPPAPVPATPAGIG